MTFESSLALIVAVFVLGLTPGPCVFAIVARALALGFRSTLIFIAGVIMGDLVYLVLAALGLSVFATEYASLFGWVKIAGGLYLVYLGVQTWRSAKNVDTGLIPVPAYGKGRSFLSGLSLTLGNPKAVVFYFAFLPAFMDLITLNAFDLGLASILISMTLLVVLGGYAWMGAKARTLFRSPKAVKTLHRSAGGLMVVAGGAVTNS